MVPLTPYNSKMVRGISKLIEKLKMQIRIYTVSSMILKKIEIGPEIEKLIFTVVAQVLPPIDWNAKSVTCFETEEKTNEKKCQNWTRPFYFNCKSTPFYPFWSLFCWTVTATDPIVNAKLPVAARTNISTFVYLQP